MRDWSAKMNFYDHLAAGFPKDRSRPCFTMSDGSSISYGELEAGAAHAARRLADEGVAPGDRVILKAPKSAASIMLYLGALMAGAVFTPLNPDYTAAEMDYFRADAEPKLVITDADAWVAEARKGGRMEKSVARADEDIAAIIYTSGTTGKPKGAQLTHGSLLANAVDLHRIWKFSSQDVLLHALPIFHVHGLFISLHCAFLSGCEVLWFPKFSEAAVLPALKRATVMMGVPTFYVRLLTREDLSPEAVSNVRLFISGSAPLHPQTFEDFAARTGMRICERYGMSEALIITSNSPDRIEADGSVGAPLPGVELRVAESGEIEIRGPSLFGGYWRKPRETAESFTADGFFRTGDVGRQEADGRVWITGRAKDIVISGGFNVSPREVEMVLDDLPGIVESAVIGAPHPDFGEGVVAIVVGEGEAGDVMASARKQLAAYKSPKAVVFVKELPRNAMGKVTKAELRREYAGIFKA